MQQWSYKELHLLPYLSNFRAWRIQELMRLVKQERIIEYHEVDRIHARVNWSGCGCNSFPGPNHLLLLLPLLVSSQVFLHIAHLQEALTALWTLNDGKWEVR